MKIPFQSERWNRLSFRLPALIALCAAATGLIAAFIAYELGYRELVMLTEERMALVRNERTRAVAALMEDTRIGLASLATRPGLAEDLEALSREFRKLTDPQREAVVAAYTTGNRYPAGSRGALDDAGDNSGYSTKHKSVHGRLLLLQQIKELDDLMLLDALGNVVYSVMKEPDFGTNFLNGPYKDTNAAKVFRGAVAAQPPWEQAFADMEPYGPSGHPAMFMGQAVRDDAGAVVGVMMFQLNNQKIRDAANHIQDLGASGEVYLVGTDATRRSQTRFSRGALMAEKIETTAATRAAAGLTGTVVDIDYKGDETVAAFGPIEVLGVRWGIVSKIDLREALAPLRSEILATGAGVLLSTFLIALFGYAGARRISRPLDGSLRVLEKLSRGDLNVVVEDDTTGVAETRQISTALRVFHGNMIETQRLVTEITHGQEQLTGLLDSSPTGIIVLSEGKVLFVNDPGALTLGREKATFVGERFSFADVAVRESEARRFIDAARRDGVVKNAGLAITGPDGGEIALSLSVRRTTFKGQDAFLIWFDDVTESLRVAAAQKKLQADVEAALNDAQNASARTEAILSGAPDPIVIVRSDSTIEYVNQQVSKVLGYAPEDLIGQQLEMLLPKRFRSGHRSLVRGFFETGGVRLMGAGRELAALKKSGGEIRVAIALSPVRVGDKPVVIASIRDITEQEKAADALRESQQLLSGVIQNSKTVIFVKRQGRYIMVNKAWEELTGVSAAQAHNKTDLDVFDEASARKIMENDAAVIASRKPTEYEEPVEVGGKKIHFLSIKFPYFNAAGEVDGLCGMSTDITERIAAEKLIRQARDAAESATKAKSDFLASMSHEIRTPMNGITGMTDLLGQTSLDDEQKHMVRTIRESGNALITVINDILDFSKIEAGKLDLENVGMSVADAVEGVATTLTPNAAKKGVRIHVFVDPKLPAAVQGDPTRLRQILFNLGGNAVKFSDGRDVQIRAGFAARSDDGRTRIRFNVIDRGIGISPANQAKLFQAFSQAESSTTRRFGGTGLGLAICKRLTEMMGGTIGLESREGEGSTFWVELPFEVIDGAKSRQKERDLHGLHVLLVGSEGPRADATEAYLRHYGAEISRTPDADAAVALLAKEKFDSVMIDLGLDRERQARGVAQLRKGKARRPPMILLQDYQNRGARIVEDDLVSLDANPLIAYRVVSAVAVAAGRASPQIKTDDDVAAFTRAKAPTVDEARVRGQLILLAEDNLTNQDVIRRQLNLIGYTCEIAGNGAEALKAYKTGRYALLLTDCHMPVMDGYELTGAIRAEESGTGKHLPIVAVTANALQGEAERCLAAGMDDYVSKPIAMPALVAALRKWMPGPRLAEQPAPAPAAKPAAKARTVAAVIDERALKDTFGDDDAMFKEILLSFVEPSEAIIGDIISAWERKMAGDVKDAAHKLKSSARSIGANALADTCVALEAAGKAGDWAAIDNLAPKARAEFGEVAQFISKL